MTAVRADRNPIRPLTEHERANARAWCHNTARRLTQPPDNPQQVAQELLWATGLDPDPNTKTRRKGRGQSNEIDTRQGAST